MSGFADAWMPLYVADYLRDTQDLSAAEHGAYILLLMHAWTRGGVLPEHDERLRRISRMTEREWKASGAIIMGFFRLADDGYRHKRVDHELARADAALAQRSAAGKASAEARKRQREGNDRSTAVATEPPTEGQRNTPRKSNHPHSPKKEEPPYPQSAEPPGLNPEFAAVMEAGGFISPPGDFGLLAEWQRRGADLEQDILPVMRRKSAQIRGSGGRTPYRLKLFEPDVLGKLAEDQMEIERLLKAGDRIRRQDERQAREDQAA